jgi:hypothetical protein
LSRWLLDLLEGPVEIGPQGLKAVFVARAVLIKAKEAAAGENETEATAAVGDLVATLDDYIARTSDRDPLARDVLDYIATLPILEVRWPLEEPDAEGGHPDAPRQ